MSTVNPGPSPSTTGPAETRRRGSAPRFSARDLLQIAIFVVIYLVVVFAVLMIGAISPLVNLIALPLSAAAAGIPYVLFLARVRHPGMVTLFGVVFALLCLVLGHPWISTVLTIVVSLLAELVLWTGRYRSRWAAIWATTVFSAWYAGPWLPFLLDRQAYLHSPAIEALGPDYIAALDRVMSAPVLLGVLALTVVAGFLGGLLGTAMLKKHFLRAGLA